MRKPEDITGVAVFLRVDEDLSLFALLAADGSMNRLGTGTIDNAEKKMCIEPTRLTKTTGMGFGHASVEGEGQHRTPTCHPITGVTGECGALPLDRSLRDGRPLSFPHGASAASRTRPEPVITISRSWHCGSEAQVSCPLSFTVSIKKEDHDVSHPHDREHHVSHAAGRSPAARRL